MKLKETLADAFLNILFIIFSVAPIIYLGILPLPPHQGHAHFALVVFDICCLLLINKLLNLDEPRVLSIQSWFHSNPKIIAERKKRGDIMVLEEDVRIHSLSDNHHFLGVFLMTDRYAAIYRPRRRDYDVVSFNGDNLRWISKVDTYTLRNPTLTMDIEIDFRWYTIEIYSGIGDRIYTILRQIFDSPALANRYRRLPNERVGPFRARDASGPVTVYKTPLWLVVIRDGLVVHQVQLDQVDDIGKIIHKLGLQGLNRSELTRLTTNHMHLEAAED